MEFQEKTMFFTIPKRRLHSVIISIRNSSVCTSFNRALRNSNNVVSDDWMIVNNEFGRM
jgi:hypothetical protein